MNKYCGQCIALSADYNTWLIPGRHHSVVLIHMIPVVSSTFLSCHWLYIDNSIDSRPPHFSFRGWNWKGFIYNVSLWLWVLKISVYTWESAWHMMKYIYAHYCTCIMTPSNGNIFHVTSLLCGEFTGQQWIPPTKASDAELWCFLWSAPEPTVEQTMETPVIRDAIVLIMMSL